jgi:hypothetical protein
MIGAADQVALGVIREVEDQWKEFQGTASAEDMDPSKLDTTATREQEQEQEKELEDERQREIHREASPGKGGLLGLL